MESTYKTTGTAHVIGDIMQVTDAFKKRELVLEVDDGAYTHHVKFEFVQDNVTRLDGINKGDLITVVFNITGRAWTDKNTGEIKYFNTLKGFAIEHGIKAKVDPLAGDDDMPF